MIAARCCYGGEGMYIHTKQIHRPLTWYTHTERSLPTLWMLGHHGQMVQQLWKMYCGELLQTGFDRN